MGDSLPSEPFDLVIEGARIADGTGASLAPADVALAGDRFAAIGALADAPARERLDARGLVLAPGFVDVHVHSDSRLFEPGVQEASLLQGVTTHVVGQDGFGFAPTTAASFRFMQAYTAAINGSAAELSPGGIGDYLARVDGGVAINVAALVPNGCLRYDAIGNSSRAASDDELGHMRESCARALADGAAGVSSGLDYVPSRYASTEELAAIASALVGTGLPYVTHVRYELGLLAALAEALEIGRAAGVPVHVSHLRSDPDYGAAAEEVVAAVDEARAAAIELTYDIYPYTYGSSFLSYVLPGWALEGEPEEILRRLADQGVRDRIRAGVAEAGWSWSRLVLAGELSGEDGRLVGLDLAWAAAARGTDEVDLVCDLLIAHELDALIVWKPDASPGAEDDLRALLAHPAAMLGSDGIYGPGRMHPRGYGAFARFVGPLVRDGLLPLEEAVARVTSIPARRFAFADRGQIRPGAFADLVLFDPDALADRATFDHGDFTADGVRDVFVNGTAVVLDGALTSATPGRGLVQR